MRGHNICFRLEIRLYLNYPQCPSYLELCVTGLLHNRIMTPNIQEYLSLLSPGVYIYFCPISICGSAVSFS